MEGVYQSPAEDNNSEENICYQASNNFLSRTIAGETVLIPVGEQTKRLNGFITFTETGQFLWNLLLQKKCTKNDLVLSLSQEYDCSEAELLADVNIFLDKAINNGMVVRCE